MLWKGKRHGDSCGKDRQMTFLLYKTSMALLINGNTRLLVSLKNTSAAIYNNIVRSHLCTKQSDIDCISCKPKKEDTMCS